MISDMSWLISAWKAKVSTSSSAIVSVLVLESYGRDYEARAKAVRDVVGSREPSDERIGGGSFQKLKADLDMATAALPG